MQIGTEQLRVTQVLGTTWRVVRGFNGTEAVEWGVVHGAHPAEALDGEVAALVARLAGGATVALGLTKWLLHDAAASGLDESMRLEAFALELSSRSEDFR